MSKSRLEWKVGVFVFIGLALLAALLLEFSKGMTFFRPTYEIRLQSENVGGLKVRAGVLMSGVQIGTVSSISLSPSGTNVTILLRIYKPYRIHRDAQFVMEQAGFLGDTYVGILPTKNEGGVCHNGDAAEAEPPFNIQEFTRTAGSFMVRIDETVKKLNDALAKVTEVVLNPQTLTNMADTLANLRDVSVRARTAVDNLNALVVTNAPGLSVSTSNLMLFSEHMNQFSAGLNALVETNSREVHVAVKNLETSSEKLQDLLADVQAGKGLAGKLLQDQQIASNVSEIANNLSITTSNLNRLGLWGVRWSHKAKPAKQEEELKPLAAPKNPFKE